MANLKFIREIIRHYPFSATATIAASTLAALLSLAIGVLTSVPEIKLTTNQTAELKGFRLSNFLEPKAIPISIFVAVIYICYSSVMTFLTPYAREIELLDSASFFFIVYAIVVLCLYFPVLPFAWKKVCQYENGI